MNDRKFNNALALASCLFSADLAFFVLLVMQMPYLNLRYSTNEDMHDNRAIRKI